MRHRLTQLFNVASVLKLITITLQLGLYFFWNVTFWLNTHSFTWVITPHLNRCLETYWALIFHQLFWKTLANHSLCWTRWLANPWHLPPDWNSGDTLHSPRERGWLTPITDGWVAAYLTAVKRGGTCRICSVGASTDTQRHGHRLHLHAGPLELSGPTSEVWCVKGRHLVLPEWWERCHVPLQPGMEIAFYSSLHSRSHVWPCGLDLWSLVPENCDNSAWLVFALL